MYRSMACSNWSVDKKTLVVVMFVAVAVVVIFVVGMSSNGSF